MSRPASAVRRGLPVVAAGVAVPADRRFRRPEVRPDRRKRSGRALWIAAKWLVMLAIVVGAVVWAVHHVPHSPLLAVRQIAVRGNVRLSTGEVEALLADVRGQNVLSVDFDEYRRRVLDSPWVERVTLSRILPSTIEVRIAEREPMAVARLGRQLYLVDRTGIIVDESGSQYGEFDLPIVDGLMSSAASSGPIVDPARARLTATLLAALATKPDLLQRLSQVDVSNDRDAAVMFDHDSAWLHLGDTEFVERIDTYLELGPTLRERFQGIDYVDLRFNERVFVRARSGSTQVTLAAR